jgi:hypothetical protein
MSLPNSVRTCILLLALGSSGCASDSREIARAAPPSPEVVTRVERVACPIPAALLTCASEPRADERARASMGVAMTLATDVTVAGDDCRAKLAEVRALVEQCRQP